MKFKILSILLLSYLIISPTKSEVTTPEDQPPPNETDSAETGDGDAKAKEGDKPAEGGDQKAATDEEKPSNTENMKAAVKCKNHLLETYKLKGLVYAEEMKLDMCPGVKNSCCKIEDQLTIFDNWVREEEGKQLTDRLQYHFDVYSELILELEKAVPIASMLSSKGPPTGIRNCKLLSKKVLEYQIAMVGPKLKEAVRAMHAFLQDTYKGVYCSLCNADYHEFFHVEKKTLTISPQFCRSIISNSLHVFSYYHIHLKKLSNLVGIMLTSCNIDGNFEHAISVPVELNFVVDDVDERELVDCYKNVNTPSWYAYCGRFCEEFHISKFSEFFQPDLLKYKKFTKFLRTKFDKFLPPEKQSPEIPNEAAKEGAKEGAKEEKKEEKKEVKKAERILSRKFYRDRYLEDAAKKEENKSEKKSEKNDEKKDEPEKKGTEEEKKTDDDSDEESKEGENANEEEKKKEGEEEEEVKVDPNDLKPTNIMDLTQQWVDLNVIRRTINGITPLEKFETYCGSKGIDLYVIGKTAVINEAVYNTVKALVEEMNKKKPEPQVVVEEEPGFFARISKSLFG